MRLPGLVFLAFMLCSFELLAVVNITALEQGGLRHWEKQTLEKETRYNLTMYAGHPAIKAYSKASASGLVLKKEIDLSKTPFISWSWLIKNKLPLMNEQSKAGDDYAARIILVFNPGMTFWQAKALTYVWSSNQETESRWHNPFARENMKMIAVRGKQASTDHWYTEKRNLYQDLIDAFGDQGSPEENLKHYRYIEATAIMTDTDNTRSQVETYYGDIIFSAE